MKWFVYMVQCSDLSLYTGITTDLERRVSQHNKGKGAKALKGKLPVHLVYTEEHGTRSIASKREFEIKQLNREQKLKLVR